MADILETVSNTSVKVEYDDPYSGSPFFSGDSLSAKIEKSPTVILHQEESHSSKDAESESISMESSVHELPEMTTSSDFPSEEHPASHDSDEPNRHMEDELCYENVSANNLQIKEAKTPSPQTSFELYQGKDISPENIQNDFEDLDSAIYDAPWDLGALQKGLEEKFKMNKQCSQEDPNVFETQTAASNPPPDSSSTLSAIPSALAYKSKNSPESLAKFSKQGLNLQQSTKGRSPSRKTEPTPILDLTDSRQALQKRPLPAFPTPQSTPASSLNFPSGSLASSTNDRQHFHHPLQRKGVPAMGGGSVGRGHQSRPQMARTSDWRPLEDYDSPWDNRQKDLMSTFSQEPSSLRGSMKIIAPHQYSSLVERIESRLPLEHEWWYHGPITRQDAEKRLKNEREGSYLIRNSESNRLDYSLSIKSSTGCIHLKIVPNAEGRFILGQFSQPFASVAQMIQHYTVNKLPIKGAEHMSLTFPVGH